MKLANFIHLVAISSVKICAPVALVVGRECVCERLCLLRERGAPAGLSRPQRAAAGAGGGGAAGGGGSRAQQLVSHLECYKLKTASEIIFYTKKYPDLVGGLPGRVPELPDDLLELARRCAALAGAQQGNLRIYMQTQNVLPHIGRKILETQDLVVM